MTDASPAPGFARRVARSLLLTGLGSVSARVLGLGALLVALRWVSPQELGLASLVLAITAVLRAAAELSLGAALVQAAAPTREETDALAWLSLLAAMLAFGAVWVLAPLIAIPFDSADLVGPLRAQAGVLPLGALGMVPRVQLERSLQMGRLALADNAGTIVGAVALIVTAWLGLGVWAFVIGELVNRATQSVGAHLASPYRPRGLGRGAHVGPLLRFGLYTSGSRLLFHLYINADYLVVGALVTEEALGLYAFAYRIVLDPTRGLTNVVVRVAYPTLSRLQDDHARLLRYLEAFVRLSVGSIGVLLVVGGSTLDAALVAVGYDRWLPAVPLVWIFSGVALLHTVTPLMPQVLNAVGRARDNFIYSVVSAVVMPAAFFAGGWLYGTTGVAWSWLIAYPLVGWVSIVMVSRVLEIGSLRLLGRLTAGAWMLLPLLAVAIGLRELWPADGSLLRAIGMIAVLGTLGLVLFGWRERQTLAAIRSR